MGIFAGMKKISSLALFLGFLVINLNSFAGDKNYWQQAIAYQMEIDFDVNTNQFTGISEITYTNNSPDTLTQVFFHLYFNAFQPGSMMDVRSRTIEDPDPRVGSRIAALTPEQIGYTNVKSLSQKGEELTFETSGTILEVKLAKPILPGKKTTFRMEFESQVPLQIRRSGRDNKEEIRYSMTQWYPKLCEYDEDGWHSNPYIGREFHGVFGDFDVKINIDSSYTVAATGYLQNKEEIGHGYIENNKVTRPNSNKLTWHFKAENVHDFAWAADPDYTHTIATTNNGVEIHFFYQTDTCKENWEKLPEYAVKCIEIMDETFGEYPYKKYSVIQGGDGGMEYPMATLVVGRISLRALVSVTVHEAIHSWYQHALATNEAKYPWMDEGFTNYAQDYVLNILYGGKKANPHLNAYRGYYRLVKSGKEEALTTPADHYKTNFAYGVNSYSKGQVLLHQLSYVVGDEVFFKGMKNYYDLWKFKHPKPEDFKRVMEKASNMELDWYFDHFVGTTNHIDYGIKSVNCDAGITKITLERIGAIPMPIDIMVELNSGDRLFYTIPMRIMRGAKAKEGTISYKVQEDWPWVYPEYAFSVNHDIDQIKQIIIDPSGRLADINQEDNAYPNQKTIIFESN